ncbi:MAG: YtxH domain-containing protein [Candidatus Limnocylindria bacterium]
MRVKDLSEIRDIKDLKDVDRKDVIELLDELRTIASKSATELLGSGKKNARRAIGAPGEGAVSMALIGGVVLGMMVGALLALVFSPFSRGEARERLTKEVSRIKERAPAAMRGDDGGSFYPPESAPETMGSPRSGSPEGTPTA